jgi:AcrR family transcriptional regulator
MGYEDGRTRLLAAARKAATETMSSRVSLRDIAKAADLSPAACYRYFSSREKLADALAGDVCTEIITACRLAAHGETAAHDRLAAAAGAYLAYAVAHRGAFDLTFERAEGGWADEERALAGMNLAHMFGDLAGRPDLGPSLWGAIHGLVDLLVKGLIDIGQRELGASIIVSRGEMLLRGLLSGLKL